MSTYGLQVFNADGSLGFTTSDRLTRILGVLTASASGSLVHPGLSQGTPFYFVNPSAINYPVANTQVQYPDISVSGNTLTWTVYTTGYVFQLIFGVY